MSLSAIGTPWSGPMKRPSRASMSRCTATLAAASRSSRTQAFTAGSTASMRFRQAANRLDGESAPARMRRAASAAPISYMTGMSVQRVQHLGDHLEAPERRHEIGARMAGAHVAKESLRHLDPDAQAALARLLHAGADPIRHRDAGHLVVQELGMTRRVQRHEADQQGDWGAATREEPLEHVQIVERLRLHPAGARLDLGEEALHLTSRLSRAGIQRDAHAERRGLADRGAGGVQTAIHAGEDADQDRKGVV